MSETCAEPALARYRDSVTDLTEAGEPFGVVEDVINQAGELTDDAKAALWPLAFALRDRDERGGAGRGYLALVSSTGAWLPLGEGRGFVVPSLPARSDHGDGGLGLLLVDRLADRWGVEGGEIAGSVLF